MARRPFIAGNWKLNLGPNAAAELAVALRTALGGRTDVDIAVFPTTLSIAAVQAVLADSRIEVGIQELEPHTSGAWTGTSSPVMAREAGCTRCLIGHSERRQHYGETDQGVNLKVKAALAAGILPIVCVGETLAERDANLQDEVVTRQVVAALEGVPADQISTITIAYEPVWAIGTGRTASPEQAQEVHATIRKVLTRYGDWVAEAVRIQYGGSVTPATAASLLSQPDIDGALVGGAALKADAFTGIIAWAR